MATLASQPSGSVLWGPTLALNVLRAACAALAWGLLAVLLSDAPVYTILTMPLMFAIGYWMFVPIYRLALGILSAVLPGDNLDRLSFGLFNGLIGLAFALGDPLVFAIHRQAPARFPVDHYPVFSPTVTLYVLE